ncbi:MAG: hypothetical protein JNM14_04405 [Ferruginibacter sp.]|nr:hypothetical protein [Ferruginibacter sp.]
MFRIFFISLLVALSFASCVTHRVAQNETVLFPETGKGKWWIINTVLYNRQYKEVHFNALVSMDEMAGKKYAACYVSAWNAADTTNYYTGIRTVAIPVSGFRRKFPLKLWLPANDSAGMDWSLVLKRNSFNLLTDLKSKMTTQAKGYTEFSASFGKQYPFTVTSISAAPQAWAVNPLTATAWLKGSISSAGTGNLQVRIFSDKDLLLKKSAAAYVHWLDLELQDGKHLALLFSTYAEASVKTEAAMLWDEQHQIMAKPQVTMKLLGKENVVATSLKLYPLFFSIEIPQQQFSIMLRPRMRQQEITANKNSFWMGAVEAIDKATLQFAGKGNMYIFKQ